MRAIVNFDRDWLIFQKYDAGVTVDVLTREYNLSESRIYRIIRDCADKDNGLYSHIMSLRTGYGFDIWACNYAYHWLMNYTSIRTIKELIRTGWTKNILLDLPRCGDRTADVIATAIATVRLDRRY